MNEGSGCLDVRRLCARADRLPERDVRSHSLGDRRRPGRAQCPAAGQGREGVRRCRSCSRRSASDTGLNGPTQPAILAELEGIEPIDRSSMNALEDDHFREAVQQTGRGRLIIGGLHTEICLTFATVQALKDRVRRDVRRRRGRRSIADRAPHRHREAGARRRGAEHGVVGRHRTLPRLGGTTGRAGPRGHPLVFPGGPTADRRRGGRGGGEARRTTPSRTSSTSSQPRQGHPATPTGTTT